MKGGGSWAEHAASGRSGLPCTVRLGGCAVCWGPCTIPSWGCAMPWGPRTIPSWGSAMPWGPCATLPWDYDIPSAPHLGCPENMGQLNRVRVLGRVRLEPVGDEHRPGGSTKARGAESLQPGRACCGLWFGTSASVPHFPLLLMLSQKLCGHEKPPPL